MKAETTINVAIMVALVFAGIYYERHRATATPEPAPIVNPIPPTPSPAPPTPASLRLIAWSDVMTLDTARAPRPKPVEPDSQDNGPFHAPAPEPAPAPAATKPANSAPVAAITPEYRLSAWLAVPGAPGYQKCSVFDRAGNPVVDYYYPSVPGHVQAQGGYTYGYAASACGPGGCR